MTERKALVVSCGLSLLSTAMISNLTPAAFFLLKTSPAMNWYLWSWLVPVAAIRPDNGSIQAIFTVWPFCAETPQALAKMIEAATALMARCMGCLLVTKPRSLAGCHGARIRVYPCSFPPFGAAQTPGRGLGAAGVPPPSAAAWALAGGRAALTAASFGTRWACWPHRARSTAPG